MAHEIRLTIRELGESIQRQFGGRLIPDWKLRRVVDALEDADALNVQRVGRYRTVSANHVGTVADALRRLDWLRDAAPIDVSSLAALEAAGTLPTPVAG